MTKLSSIERFVGGGSQINLSKLNSPSSKFSKMYSKTQKNFDASPNSNSKRKNSGYSPSPFASPRKGTFKKTIPSKYGPSPRHYGANISKTGGNLKKLIMDRT